MTDPDQTPKADSDVDQDRQETRLSLCITGGIVIGSILGAALDNVGLWLPLGMVFGAALALSLDESSGKTASDEQNGGDDSAP